MNYHNPAPTVNLILLNDHKIVLVKRLIEPYKNKFALPGGYVEYGETVEQAALRETKEEVGVDIKLVEILGVYSDPLRNPTKHTISTVFIAVPLDLNFKNSVEGEVVLFPLQEAATLDVAFDHTKIILDFMQWQKKKGTSWSTR